MNYNAQFEITSGKVHLTDPAFTTDTWCGAYNIPAKNGVWNVEVEHMENRVKSFSAWHQDHKKAYTNVLPYVLSVDSGQFGIFDTEIYDGESEFGQPGFYNDCCNMTLTREGCGPVSEKGFVTSSGYGDGSYVGAGAFDDDGNLVKFCVDFIMDDAWQEIDFEDEDDF